MRSSEWQPSLASVIASGQRNILVEIFWCTKNMATKTLKPSTPERHQRFSHTHLQNSHWTTVCLLVGTSNQMTADESTVHLWPLQSCALKMWLIITTIIIIYNYPKMKVAYFTQQHQQKINQCQYQTAPSCSGQHNSRTDIIYKD